MNTSPYEQIAKLISHIRNARFGQMVNYLEELIAAGTWRDFTTPEETHFEFREGEFDYFLAVMEIDPDVVRHAYASAKDVDGLVGKRLHLADITGRGEEMDRREKKIVAELYGDRVLRYGDVVSDTTAGVASDPEKRREYEATGKMPTMRQRWLVDIKKDDTAAHAIADKLLADPDLAHEVWKILHSAVVNDYQKKRRSGRENGQ